MYIRNTLAVKRQKKLEILGAFHLYGESICSGKKKNGTVLPTGKLVSDKMEYFKRYFLFSRFHRRNGRNITVPFCFFTDYYPALDEKRACSSGTWNGTVLSTGTFSSGTNLSRTIVSVKKLYSSICRIFLTVFSTHNEKRSLSTLLFVKQLPITMHVDVTEKD